MGFAVVGKRLLSIKQMGEKDFYRLFAVRAKRLRARSHI
jgi:hypothetical protein